MKKHLFITFYSALFILLLSAYDALYAIDMEYITYNGFDPIVAAFQKISLIFSDNSYKALFFSVIVAGILGGVISVLAKAAGGAKTSAFAWAFPVGIGVILYLGLFIPQGTLTIHDEAKNRTQAITVPNGIVAVAGLFNAIEHGLVEIVQTASDPLSYMQNAGGIGFDMLFNIGSKGIMLTDKNLMANLNEYSKDCVLFEIQRPGTTLTTKDIGKNMDFMALYALAASPSNYTTYYSDTHPEGEATTCSLAWSGLSAGLVLATKYDDALRTKCADAGFDPANASELNQCKTLFSDTTNWLYGSSYSYITVMRQSLMANAINDALNFTSPDTAAMVLASRNTGTSMVSSGIVANQWIPVIKGVLTAVAIGIIPLLVIFIPTPLFSKALSIICGFFIWLAVWGVTDAIVHSFGMDYARKVYDEVAQHQLGTVAIMNFGSSSLKALAAFGAIRWAGLMLATIVTGMLVKFGGHAVAQLARQLTSSVQHGGGSAGMAAVTPEGRAQELSKIEGTPTTMSNAYRYSFQKRSAIKTAEMAGKTSGMSSLLNEHGNAGVTQMIAKATTAMTLRNAALGNAAQYMGTVKFVSNATKGKISSNAAEGAYQSNADADYIGNIKGQQQIGSAKAFDEIAKEFGMSPEELASNIGKMTVGKSANVIEKYAQRRGISFQDAAKELGELTGSMAHTANMAYGNTRDAIGERGVEQVETDKKLNEAAKMDQLYEFAKFFGYAGSRDDFAGFYEYNKLHHATDSLMIDNEEMANRVNAAMQKMGYNTRFKVGQKVSVGRLQDGSLTLARGEGGAELSEKDYHNKVHGRRDDHYDVKTSTTGTRGSHGNINEDYNINTFEGTRIIKGPDGKDITVSGKWQKDRHGNIVSATYTNSVNNKIVSERAVLTGYDENKKPIYHRQLIVADQTLNNKGQVVLDNVTNISTRETSKNGYNTKEYVGPNGEVLYEENTRGQDTKDVKKLTLDRNTEFKGSLGSPFIGDGDITNTSTGKIIAIMALSSAEKGIQILQQGNSVVRNLPTVNKKVNQWAEKKTNPSGDGRNPGGNSNETSNATLRDHNDYNNRLEATTKPVYPYTKESTTLPKAGRVTPNRKGNRVNQKDQASSDEKNPDVQRINLRDHNRNNRSNSSNANPQVQNPTSQTQANAQPPNASPKRKNSKTSQTGKGEDAVPNPNMNPTGTGGKQKVKSQKGNPEGNSNKQNDLPSSGHTNATNNTSSSFIAPPPNNKLPGALNAAVPFLVSGILNNNNNKQVPAPSPVTATNNLNPNEIKQQYPNMNQARSESGIRQDTINAQSPNAQTPNVSQTSQVQRPAGQTQVNAQSPNVNQTGKGEDAVPNPNMNQARSESGIRQDGDKKTEEKNKGNENDNKVNTSTPKEDERKEEQAQSKSKNNLYTAAVSENVATDAQVVSKEQFDETMKQKSIDKIRETLGNDKQGGRLNAEQFYQHLENKYGKERVNEIVMSQNNNQELSRELQAYTQQTDEQQGMMENLPNPDVNRTDVANGETTHSDNKQENVATPKEANYVYGSGDIDVPDISQFATEQKENLPNPDMNKVEPEIAKDDENVPSNNTASNNMYDTTPQSQVTEENIPDTKVSGSEYTDKTAESVTGTGINESAISSDTPQAVGELTDKPVSNQVADDSSYDLFQPKSSDGKKDYNHVAKLAQMMYEREKAAINTSATGGEPIPGGSNNGNYQTNEELIPGGNDNSIEGIPGGKQ